MPDPTDLQLLQIARNAVNRAGAIFLDHGTGAVTMKSDRNPVTEADLAIEREVRQFLLASTPHISFLGEEGGTTGKPADLMWTLDPVDGTVNFMHGAPLCGISLGLVRNDRPVIGVIALPHLSRVYSAVESHGAYCNDSRLSRRFGPTRLTDSIVALGDFAVGPQASEKNIDRLRVTERLAKSAQRVRMLGSAAIDLAWVADGSLDASVTLSNKPWDTAAGTLIAREAGARVVDRNGNEHNSHSASTVAASPQIIDELLRVLNGERAHDVS